MEEISDLIEYFLPDYLDYLTDLVTFGTGFIAAGVLVCFIFWAIAFAVSSVYGWLNSWTKARDDE